MYSISACWHEEGTARLGFRRNRATIPSATFLFCEEPEDSYPETEGQTDTVTRHFGGSNFVFADGHADWLAFTNFCRAGNAGCPPPLGNFQWDASYNGGDWNPAVHYHWWPFLNANTSQN
jgi:prepilin-type processing-associated H-X9-DG protein